MATPLHGQLVIEIEKATNLKIADTFGLSDPFVQVYLDATKIAQTKVIKANLNPIWNQSFVVDVNDSYKTIHLDVLDYDLLTKNDFLGRITLEASLLKNGKRLAKVEKLLSKKGDNSHGIKGDLSFSLKYYSSEKLETKSWKVKGVNFPSRKFNKVTLFQDAHVGEDGAFLSEVEKIIGNHEAPTLNNAWEEIYKSVSNAKHFIYITGWSVCTTISLLRRDPLNKEGFDEQDSRKSIGELVKERAKQGVTVNLMIWNDRTSVQFGGFKLLAGMMDTEDEETHAFFHNTGVNVASVYRMGSVSNEFAWSHHQKSIILDEAIPSLPNKRQVVAYVGGLDLARGRWDTPKHPLYRTLGKEHRDDYHQPWKIPITIGPRQPWHDIYCKIEGPTALDIMHNFEQRWTKQVPEKVDRLFTFDQTVFPCMTEEAFKDVFQQQLKKLHDEGNTDPAHWRVQLFRSIDHHSVNIAGTDKSIQLAYINTIQNARRFLYIENQYFMGSAFAWKTDTDVACVNRVPYEITDRICRAISKGRRFVAYIVVPMLPEGDPSDSALHEMLRWQWNTMTMMYQKIAEALQSKGLNEHPKSYLNFYCLGNRETVDSLTEGYQNPDSSSSDPKNFAHRTSVSRRFMVYVHSKMLIADDEFIIIGSANINERSMAGNRDTEIAVGCYEDNRFRSLTPRGAIQKFRLSLWGEHVGTVDPSYLTPQNAATVELVNRLAQANWEKYISPDVVDMVGHLMPYPIVVSADGTITPLIEHFPDTPAPIRGAKAISIPDLLTQ